ncbi:MAG: clostripain-related cysteine peptidase [Dysgonamonadaceae bacterium]|nr:clostripain-related cysteine peptidase [Dysgonamonadaceae bacterium]
MSKTTVFEKPVRFFFCLITISFSFFLISCEKEDVKLPNQKTVFMYLPWPADKTLTEAFEKNISDMEKAIGKRGLDYEKIVVFISTSSTKATLYEITCKNGICKHDTLKNYTNPSFTTAEGIAFILSEMKSAAPALTYAMIIGGHGMGWIPVYPTYPTNARAISASSPFKNYWEYDGEFDTRYFGGTTTKYQTDITSLAKGITMAGIKKMEYILFDNCYMSSIEVAYELRNVTNYLIASPTEIMAYGMPYAVVGEYLFGKTNYKAVCNGFYSFYSTYDGAPYGTLAVTDCSELASTASLMREINSRYTFDTAQLDSLQRMDGYEPPIFYDYGDYVAHLCTDEQLLLQFEEQLNRTIPYKTSTNQFYTKSKGAIPIDTYSGVTTSDPSTNQKVINDKTKTSWYAATH